MSTRWNPKLPSSHEPEPAVPTWRKYLLPGAGAAALLLVVVIIVALIASGGDDEDDSDDTETALDASAIATETAEAESDVQTPTPEPTTTDEGTPTPEVTVTETGEDTLTPTPTPTLVAASEAPLPTATPVPQQPAPESPPLVGDFGELPPGDMPSGSPAEALNLQYNLNMSLQAIPSQAAVYQIQRRQWTLDSVQTLASRLGIEAGVVDQGGGSFRAEGESGSIYVNPTTIQYVRPGSGAAPELPGNEALVQMARTWLTENGLTGADVGSGQVLDRDENTGRAFVLLKPVEPAEIISATPSAGVTVRGDGVVTEASINWPGSLSASTYGLRSAENLWADAIQGRGFVDINANNLPAGFQGASGTVTISNGGIAYTIAGNPQGNQYLVPVAVFSGTANIDGASEPVPVRIYVQAAAAQAVPRG